nr:putative transcriptional regulatory protein LysR [uncultured bacterium]
MHWGGAGSPVAMAEDTEWAGFVENATYHREGTGLSKMRNTVQLEMGKPIGDVGAFRRVFIGGTFRGTYDAVYDLNDDEFGDNAGGAVRLQSLADGFDSDPGTGDTAWGDGINLGSSIINTGINGPLVGAGPGGINLPNFSNNDGLSPGTAFNHNNPNAARYNPNTGLKPLGGELHAANGGVVLGVPVRPCDEDDRGCIDDYLDYDSEELKSPEFNDRWDFIRELYLDAILPQDDGTEWAFRVGKQQVVWGRTDLFRVLDVLNPVDYSRHNIYDELEDIRIPMWMLTAEKRWGPTETFGDLNFQVVWNFDKFRPNNLGQGGSPYAILQAGDFFRAMNNCWDNGCTVANFAGGAIATDFPRHTIGIREADLPGWSLDNTQLGLKLEGTYEGVGFSLNALHYRSQLPVLRGGIPARNPFVPNLGNRAVERAAFGESFGTEMPRDYLIAFDIHFPRVNLLGGSLDIYADSIKSVFRVEAAVTSGEEFANSLERRLYSESDVARWVVGWDRPTFIPFLNKRRAFLLSAQLFGQHLLDHERKTVNGIDVGMPDHEDNYIMTFLLKGWYEADTISPQLIIAHDFEGQATTVSPSVDWLIDNHWRLVVAANIKYAQEVPDFDDCRACNPFPGFTDLAGVNAFGPMPAGALPLRNLAGQEPLGRFLSGPLGMADDEDEIQVTLRYRF